MTNNLQNPDLQTSKTGEGILGEGAEKYIRDTANIEDLPGDDDDLEIDNIAQAGFSEVAIAETTIDAMVFNAENRPSPKTLLITRHLGGAIGLAGNTPGFQSEGLAAPLHRYGLGVEHLVFPS